MINEAALAMEYGASCEDVARVCHAHPVKPLKQFHEFFFQEKLIFTIFFRRSPRLSVKATSQPGKERPSTVSVITFVLNKF